MSNLSVKRRFLSGLIVLVFCAGLFTAIPAQAGAASSDDYMSQFDYYVRRAFAEGLIPPSFGGSLDEVMSEGDLLDFVFQFLKIKCGADVDEVLSRARVSSSSEERAKVEAINELVGETVWKISVDGELLNKVDLYSSFFLFEYMGYRHLAPLSPLFFYADDPLASYSINRYNFQNYISAVVYHMDVTGGLMSEIVGLSQGRPGSVIYGDDTVTRRQFAAFCYMFSTMSLPKDSSGKYPGALSGNNGVDWMVEEILGKAISPGMTDLQQVKAIYNHLIYNYEHNSDSFPILLGSYEGRANPLVDTADIAQPLLLSGSGTCDTFANTFRLLALRLGFECNYVSGYYIRTDGSKNGHGWNQIKVDGVWYWVDVDVENTVFKSTSSAKEPSYFLFMKNDADWVKTHSWERSDWPAADGTKHPTELLDFSKEALTAIPTTSTVLVNGEPVAFDAYNIDGSNYFKLRDLAYILSGTEKQFEVGWDGGNNAISLTSGKPYTSVGGEMQGKGSDNKTPIPTSAAIYLDGKEVSFTAYNIDGNNYFKLRDIGQTFDFGVTWDGANNTVVIDTAVGYTPD